MRRIGARSAESRHGCKDMKLRESAIVCQSQVYASSPDAGRQLAGSIRFLVSLSM